MNNKLQILVIIFLTVIAYSNIFQNQFLIDDETFIVGWEQVKSWNSLPGLLRGEVPEVHQGVYRPIRSVLYLFYQQIFGQNPFGYHLHSLTVHLLSTVLVYLIIGKISKKNTVAFIGALLFGLHPVHTESITYISASMEMTGVVFFLASFYLYLKQKALLSIIFAALAFFTYEMTLTLPLLIGFYDFCFKKLNYKKYLPYFAGAGVFLFIRMVLLGIGADRGEYLGFSFYHTMLMMIKVVWKYIWLLVSPINVSYLHDLAPGFETFMTAHSNISAILSQSIFDWDVILAILGLIALGVTAIKTYHKYPLATFGIGWFFISLLPVSYIFPQGIAMADKYLYIPSVAFVLLVAAGLSKLKNLSFGILLVLASSYLVMTYMQNNAWKDGFTFWHKLEAQHPNSALAVYTLGVLYSNQEDLENAQKYYSKTLELDPRFWEASFNLGNTYWKLGRTDLAASEYQKVLLINPQFQPAIQNLQKMANNK